MAEKIVVKRPAKDAADANAQTGSGNVAGAQIARDADASERNKTTAAAPAPAKRRKLYVHIGMHKTGTTSIQYAFHENMQTLMLKGYLYPSTGRHPMAHVQHALVHMACDTAARKGAGLFQLKTIVDPKIVLPALVHEIDLSGADRIILSAEDFWTLDANGVAAFGRTFHEFDIEPIIYVRSFADWLDALFQTKIKYNMVSQSEICDPNYRFWTELDHVDLLQQISNWAQISGDGKCWVQNYDADGHNDSMRSFCKIIGLDILSLGNSKSRLNSSLPMVLTLLKMELLRRGVSANYADHLVGQLGNVPFEMNLTLIPLAERRKLDARYDDALARLFESDFVKFHPELTQQTSSDRSEKSYIAGLSGVLFAIGRAVSGRKFQS